MPDEVTSAKPSPRPKRCWFRFSLRTLIAVVTVLCIWLGIQVNAARRQPASIKESEAFDRWQIAGCRQN
jgi:hypothetical protein